MAESGRAVASKGHPVELTEWNGARVNARAVIVSETLREWGPISAAARGGSGVSERTVQRWANPAWAKARGLEPLPVKRDALGRRWITRAALEAWEHACLSCNGV